MYISIRDCLLRFTEEWPGSDGPLPDQNLPLLQTWALSCLKEIGIRAFCDERKVTLDVKGGYADNPHDCVSVVGYTSGTTPHVGTSRIYAPNARTICLTYMALPIDCNGEIMIPEIAEEAVIADWVARWARRLGLDKATRDKGYQRDYPTYRQEADRLIGWTRGNVKEFTLEQKLNLLAYRQQVAMGRAGHGMAFDKLYGD